MIILGIRHEGIVDSLNVSRFIRTLYRPFSKCNHDKRRVLGDGFSNTKTLSSSLPPAASRDSSYPLSVSDAVLEILPPIDPRISCDFASIKSEVAIAERESWRGFPTNTYPMEAGLDYLFGLLRRRSFMLHVADIYFLFRIPWPSIFPTRSHDWTNFPILVLC